MWKTKWGYYIQSSGIADMSGSNQTQTMRAELNLAMSDATIQWLNSEDITTEQREDAEFVINRIEEYVKNSSNALVTVMDTLHIKHPVGSSVAAWGQKVWEMSLMCDTEKITNPREWVCLLSLGLNMSIPQVMTKVLLMKNPELTFHKVLDICIEEEKAIKTARKLNQGSADRSLCCSNVFVKVRPNKSRPTVTPRWGKEPSTTRPISVSWKKSAKI